MSDTVDIRKALERGLEALNSGRPKVAESMARQVLEAEPKSANAYFLLGLAARQAGQIAQALQALGKVTNLAPTHADAWAQAAELFAGLGDRDRARVAVEQAQAHAGDNPATLNAIGKALSDIGREGDAGRWYAEALKCRPDDPALRVNYAINRMYLGETEASRKHLSAALAAAPNDANAHWLLAGLTRATNLSHIEAMHAILSAGELHQLDVARLNYACGKEYEDLQYWDQAFDAFAHGAQAMRTIVRYDEAADANLFAALEALWTPGWLDAGTQGSPDDRPVFIVGMPRSGTTLVERILSAHPDVTSAGELKDFGRCMNGLASRGGNSTPESALLELDPIELGRCYLNAIRLFANGHRRVVDKLPSNFLYLPLILKSLPKARVIHVKRNPMDTCFAVFKQLFSGAYTYSYDLDETARYFVRYHRLMETWLERFGDRFVEVRYEELARDPESEARRLVEHAGLAWDDACLRFHEQSSAVATASVVQVREPVHTRSIHRWRRYESQLEPVRRILEEAGIDLSA